METVTYRQVRDLWCDLCGLGDPSQVNVPDLDRFNRTFNRVIRRAWRFHFWPYPEIMGFEQRWYRDAWTAQSYPAGTEIFHAGAGLYYVAIADVTAADVPGVSANWSSSFPGTFDAFIPYEQSGKTIIDTFSGIWSGNFRTSSGTFKIPFELDERGARLTAPRVPTSVWVLFRKRCPKWQGSAFDAGSTYSAGETHYYSSTTSGFEGDFYTVLQSTAAGESPETTPQKWSRILVPSMFSDFVAHGAKIGHLEGDGALDKALADGGELWSWLFDEVDKIEGQSGQFRRARAANV